MFTNFGLSVVLVEVADDDFDKPRAEDSDATCVDDRDGTPDPLLSARSRHCPLHSPFRKDYYACLRGRIARTLYH